MFTLIRQLVLLTDASQHRILADRLEDGSEWPTTYIYKRLAEGISNYSQIEKEALATVYTVQTFHVFPLKTR